MLGTLDELNEVLNLIRTSLLNNFSESSYDLWFGKIKLVYLDSAAALFTIDKDFKKNFIMTKYYDTFRETLYACLGFEPDFEIYSDIEVNTEEEAEALHARFTEERKVSNLEENERELKRAIQVIKPEEDTDTDGKPEKSSRAYTFENFIVGDSNKFAYNACYAVANSVDGIDYNPLFIHGKSGLGKTHLMYAILNKLFSRNKNLKVVYIRGEEFTNQLVEAIKNGTTDSFHEKYRSADVLLVDDIQFIAGKSATQDEFFNTFNTLYEAEKQIIVTCDRPIKDMKNLEERIRTRLEWGLPVDITPPDTELRMAIIRKKAEEINLKLPETVVEYMAKKLKGNVRILEGGVKKLSAMKFFMGKEIDISVAEEAIADMVATEDPEGEKIEKIFQEVCDKYNISKETILSKKRKADIVQARHVCMYALYELLHKTYVSIGEIFSCDHTSVLSAVNKINDKISTDTSFRNEMEVLRNDLKDILD